MVFELLNSFAVISIICSSEYFWNLAPNFFNFNSLSKAGKLEQVDNLETLLNKQNIFYARLSLSDDPRAKEMKEQLQQQSRDLGFPDDVDLGNVFKNMHRMIEQMKKTIDEQHGRW